MRHTIIGAASTAIALLMTSSTLLAQEAAPAAGAANLCAELVRFVGERGDAQPASPITAEEAEAFRQNNDEAGCRTAFVRIRDAGIEVPATVATVLQAPAATGEAQGQAGATGAQIVVQQPAPAIQVQQAAPQVTVQQPQPEVTVSQGQPEIIVNQPSPTVTIDIPQPEIIVRMPEPTVNVAQAQPQVEVVQPEPQVQVVQPAQPQVTVEPAEPRVVVEGQANAQGNVTVEQNAAQPKVTYQSAEAKVVVNQSQGQPSVRVESLGAAGEQQAAAGEQAAAAQPAAGQEAAAQPAAEPDGQAEQLGGATGQTAAATATDDAQTTATQPRPTAGQMQSLALTDLMGREVYNRAGEQLGDVERVLRGADGRNYVVLGHGGFLSMGEKQILLPMENIQVREDRLVIPNLTDDQIRAMPEFEYAAGGADYQEAGEGDSFDLGLFEG